MKKVRRIALWATLVILVILTVLSIIGAFTGTEKAGVMFNSVPLILLWSVSVLLFGAGLFLFKRLLKRPGLFGMHAGVMLMLIGAMIGSHKGHQVFNKGKPISGYMAVFEGQANNILLDQTLKEETGKLPFRIFCKDFRIEYYSTEGEKCRLLAEIPHSADREQQQLTIPWEIGKKLDIPFTGVSVEVLNYFDSACLTYDKDAEPVLEVEMGHGKKKRLAAKAGRELQLPDGRGILRITQVFSHLVVEGRGTDRKVIDRPGGHSNPALKVEIEKEGGEIETRYVMPRMPMHGSENAVTPLKYVFPEPTGAVADPSTGLPAMEISLTHKGKRHRQWLVFESADQYHLGLSLEIILGPPAADGAHAGHGHAPQSPSLYLIRPRGQISDYKSDLVVLEEDQEIVSKTIEVNDPLHYGGYHFYQHSYDTRGGRYTVLSVRSDSGLAIVYVGFILLCGGAFWWCWLRPVIMYVKKKKRTEDGN